MPEDYKASETLTDDELFDELERRFIVGILVVAKDIKDGEETEVMWGNRTWCAGAAEHMKTRALRKLDVTFGCDKGD